MQVGNHKKVWEYDGSFTCRVCDASWGCLPGKPKMPEKCVELSRYSLSQVEVERILCRHIGCDLSKTEVSGVGRVNFSTRP